MLNNPLNAETGSDCNLVTDTDLNLRALRASVLGIEACIASLKHKNRYRSKINFVKNFGIFLQEI